MSTNTYSIPVASPAERAMLVERFQSGESGAFDEIVDRYRKHVYGLAYRFTHNTEDAYDISQEAFLRVYSSARTFDESQRFFPWFYSIVANLCRNFLRKRQINAARSVDMADVEHILADRSTPEGEYIEQEEKKRLFCAMRKLDFKDKEIINLNHFRMMSYDEIATLLNIPKGTVMSRLYYARKRLAKLLEEG